MDLKNIPELGEILFSECTNNNARKKSLKYSNLVIFFYSKYSLLSDLIDTIYLIKPKQPIKDLEIAFIIAFIRTICYIKQLIYVLAFRHLYHLFKEESIMVIEVSTPSELTNYQKRVLSKRFKKLTSANTIILINIRNPQIIIGFKLRFHVNIVDSTYNRKIKTLGMMINDDLKFN
uniref:ATP synthase CF1 delta subunit n=1 Tax=Nitzschia sp. NIES-3576 TaxID=2083273 RepID=A0A2Z5ZBG7_9STRA|nr:ATP synthase CF1 delta subunit [Nitzschia sp. NIES-3576]